jgi:hypothetical protein
VVWTQAHEDAVLKEGKPKRFHVGQIVYRKSLGRSKRQQFCFDTDQRHRIVEPLKRRNESSEVYDLTRVFMDEFIRHPFAPHDDLIDVTSRIYDMKPMAPVQYEASSTEPLGAEWDVPSEASPAP